MVSLCCVKRALIGITATAASLAAVVWVVRRVFIQATVEGISMEPTLRPGERVIAMRLRRPQAGHVVLFRSPWTRGPELLVKRVESLTSDGALVVAGDNDRSLGSAQIGPVPRHRYRGTVFAAFSHDTDRRSLVPVLRRRGVQRGPGQ